MKEWVETPPLSFSYSWSFPSRLKHVNSQEEDREFIISRSRGGGGGGEGETITGLETKFLLENTSIHEDSVVDWTGTESLRINLQSATKGRHVGTITRQ